MLIPISEQYELAENIPNSEMITLNTMEGHRGFFNEIDALNNIIPEFVIKHFGENYEHKL